ncbi:hypothetical protein D3M61_11315 [Aliarcobacter butzleri]|uniref:hypothetical protein n=1 Tax=Aliarcobacter butzleri TaxID=28197 RepID=UPI00102DF2B4|nr:hypothetical protein [Aliarcobacter butzleri]RZV12736.1 hypothetical protein D3M61_11315 [Aliarcobacter butzleri]
METLLKPASGNLVSKIMGIEYFLIFLGLFVYSDLYFFYTCEKSILDIGFEGIKENLTFGFIFRYLIYLTFLFAVFSEVILIFIELYIFKIDISNEMSYLKEKSIKNNLSPAYNHYQYKLSEISKNKLIKKIIFMDLFLIAIDFISSVFFNKVSILGYLYQPFANNKFTEIIFMLILIFPLIMLYIFIKGYVTNEWNADVEIDNHEEINQKFWLDELSLGLIDKKIMFEHLRNLIEQGIIHSIKLPLNNERINESLKFCKHFDLVNLHGQTLKLTAKGKFFSYYILDKALFKTVTVNE